MFNWLREVEVEIGYVRENEFTAVEPSELRPEWEEDVVVLNSYHRQIFCVIERYGKLLEATVAGAKTLDDAAKEKCLTEHLQLQSKINILWEIFWHSVRQTFTATDPELWTKPIYCVRKGFVLTWTDPMRLMLAAAEPLHLRPENNDPYTGLPKLRKEDLN